MVGRGQGVGAADPHPHDRETVRHAGHADIVREPIDGATGAFPDDCPFTITMERRPEGGRPDPM
jgi:hypothetical protein